MREQGTGNTGTQEHRNREQGTQEHRNREHRNREQGTGNTGRKRELIPTEFCMATPRKLSKIKYYSYS
jgi:hypothetical protein